MAKRDINALLGELNNEIQHFVADSGKWVDFLKSASWNYKYSFINQLLIYTQRPNATACAGFNVWNNRLHRYVAKGSKGIAILNETGDKVSYVFDVSDTRSNTGDDLKLWKVADSNSSEVLKLVNSALSQPCETLDNALILRTYETVDDSANVYLPESIDRADDDFIKVFSDFVKHSSCVSVLVRGGFLVAAESYAEQYIKEVPKQFDTEDKLIALGVAVSAASEAVLRELEHTVHVVDKNNLKVVTKSKEDVENGNELQAGRGISDTGYRTEGVVDGENRENGNVAAEISSSEQTDNVYNSSDDRRVGESSDRDFVGSEHTDRAVDTKSFEGQSSTSENRERAGVGTAHELDSSDGRGNSEEGTDFPLDDVLFPTVDEQLEIIEEAVNSLDNFGISQADIDCVLCNGSGFVDGKYRIYDYFLEKHTVKEQVDFLKSEYGMGGGSRVLSDGTLGDAWADAKGLSISRVGQAVTNPDVVLSWNKVQKRIGELIKDGHYLNEKELAGYPAYKEEFERRAARIEIGKEFTDVIQGYNEFLRENNNDNLLDQYVLIVGCCSEFMSGRQSTNLRIKEGELVLPLMCDALNEIVAAESPFKERAEVLLVSLQDASVIKLEPFEDVLEPNEDEFVLVPNYKVGDLFFYGAAKFSIVEVSESSVYLSEVGFELNSIDMPIENFEKVVRENPSNNHLLKEYSVEDYNKLINHANSIIDEVEHNILPDEEFHIDVVPIVKVGDFYEVRGEFARSVAEKLGFVTTRKVVNGEEVDMCGFPIRFLNEFNERLSDSGIVLAVKPEFEKETVVEARDEVQTTKEGSNLDIVKRNSLIARNYDALNRLAPGVLNGDYNYLRFEREGLEPLSVQKVGNNLISVMHTFVQYGDVMCDPDIVVQVDAQNKTVAAASYEMSSLSAYKEYIDFETGEVLDVAGQKDTNSFLSDWFKNIERQGYSLVHGRTRDGADVYFDKDGREISEEAYEGLKQQYQVRLYRPHSAPDTVKAYVAIASAPMEDGHVAENERELWESIEAAENAVDNFYTVFGYDEEFRNDILKRVPAPVLHRYYSTQRPIAPGTYPKVDGNEPVNIVNFDDREFREDIGRAAWGYLEFERALTEKQAEDYELVKAPPVEVDLNVNNEELDGVQIGKVVVLDNNEEFRIVGIEGTNENDEVVIESLAEPGKKTVEVYGFIDYMLAKNAQEVENTNMGNDSFSEREVDVLEERVAVRLRLDENENTGIDVYIEKADIPCPDTDIEIGSYDSENTALKFRLYCENSLTDLPDYRNKQYSALLVKKAASLEKEIRSLKPTVYCEWSEHEGFEDKKEYSFVEFNSLMKSLDDEVVKLKEEYKARDDYYPYFKTSFVIRFPDGFEYEGRQDIGDGDGSLLDHVRTATEYNLRRIKENGYDGYYKGEERDAAIKSCERFLNVYLPMLEDEVSDVELSYDKETYKLGYGSLGNGTTVWNSADIDKEADDYRTIAHIRDDGTVKFYVDDLPEGVKVEIKDKAVVFSANYINELKEMSWNRFYAWYIREMDFEHPTTFDYSAERAKQLYSVLHNDEFVRNVEVPLLVQLETMHDSKLSEASKETRRDIFDKVQSGEIFAKDVSDVLEHIDTYKINNENDVYDALADKFGEDVSNVKPVQKGTNFKIRDFDLGVGGPKEKYRNNVAAIKLLNQLEGEGRQATPEEQEVLSKYVGWGGLDKAFDVNNGSWAQEYNELQELLTTKEYRSAKASTLTSFYTPPVVINAIYEGLSNLGFKRGNILEPSCGVGNFFGMLPDKLADSRLYGVELDSISGRIAKQLYPEAKIAVKGYEETIFKNGFFDVAVGNVPFNSFKVNDKDYNHLNFYIHDYFFAKTLDKVRPGGVVAFITSKGTLDKQSPEVRKYIAQRAELLGAIRLPNDTFTANAGTKATSDIIFLKKREKAIETEPDWVHLTYATDKETGEILENEKGEIGKINSYFSEHPEMILGNMRWVSGPHGAELTCESVPGAVLSEQLNIALKNIQGEISSKTIDFDEAIDKDTDGIVDSIPADPNVRNFSYTLVDGEVYYRVDDEMIKQELNRTREQRVRGLIELRDCLRNLIDLQRYDYSDAEIEAEQRRLNKLYDAFSAKYGLINSRGNSMAFEDDSSYYLLCSLENVDEKGELISKADMFTKRTIKRHVPVTSVGTPSEALAVCISEKARVDLDYMSDLADMPKNKIVEELQGVIYRVPGEVDFRGEDVYVTADEYLSGNVREKLKVAQFAAETDHNFDINVLALQQVVPKDLEPQEISVRLGSTWVPEDVVNEFMWELLDTPKAYNSNEPNVKAHYNEINGSWTVENKNWYNYGVKASSTYGTKRISAYEIIFNTLNLKTVEIYDYSYEDGKQKRTLNKNETIVAQQKQELIKNEFLNWLWKDPKRRQRLVRIYNDRFNSIKLREYNGEHLVFEGMNPDITLMDHQKNAVAHAIYGGNTLLAHEVGAGKTFEMTAIAMESKRLGLCSKSLMVVPNHLIGQWATEFYQLYPSANLLVASKKDFEPANRKKFCSRIATGDYDAVIIGHSQFEKIPLSVELQSQFIQDEIDEIEQGIRELEYAGGDNTSVKSLEKTKKSLELRLEKLSDIEQDNVITFEELGVDRVFIDEAHYFKNLFLYTKMHNVAGISQTEAKKSSDLYMKTRYLNDLTGSKGVIFATGTPISNSMVEAFTMQRYLQYYTLKQNGMLHFDAWASTFGEVVTAVELAPEGTGYRAKTRFAKFHNIPELMTFFKLIADIKTGDDLNLPKPEAEFHVVQSEPSAFQEQIVESLGERAKAVRDRKVEPTEDNMLKITNDGRLLGLDQRCFDPSLPDDENSKVNKAVENIFNIWEEHKEDKLAQLVFSDISTPTGKGFSIYEDVKKKLIAKGVPENEIAFIHDAKTDVQKDKLFAKVRSGEVRVLMGSTPKMGAGTNVQDKLIALHDLDCPWRPSDLEQRLGRILRQGNQQEKVHVFRYVTKGTFDAYLWQLVENKQKFISQIMTSKSPVRSADDIDDAALSYAEIKSLCIKDPRIKEKMELDVDIAKLKLVRANFMSQKYRMEDDIAIRYPASIKRLEQSIIGYKADIEHVAECTFPDEESGFSPMVVKGKIYTERKEAGSALFDACRQTTDASKVEIGEYRGFKLLVQYDPFTKSRHLYLKGALSHKVELGLSETGNIVRMNNVIDAFADRLSEAEEDLIRTKNEFETAKVEVTKEFAQQEELNTKIARLNELEALLRMDEKGEQNEQDKADTVDGIIASATARSMENGNGYNDIDSYTK